MSSRLLEELAEWEVPPPPVELDREVHHRLNRWLLAQQLIDLACCALPYALVHFARGVWALMALTLTGRCELPGDRRPDAERDR
jgi:hypothetical protein